MVAHGGVITSAISTEVWPGDAKVHVSIVNWVQDPLTPPTEYVLDDRRVSGITTSLREGETSTLPEVLPANDGRAFQGPIPVGEGFVLTADEATEILADGRAPYERVIRPYLIGDDIANEAHQRPSRWIIDFSSMPLEKAQKFPRALAIVEERVKPERLRNKDPRFKRDWWLFGRPRGEMRDALGGLSRYLGGTATGKRLLFCWCDRSWCPSNASNVFAFEDDFAFGLLSSAAHLAWAWRWSSTMKSDLRYTPTTVFATLPWPYPVDDSKREEVSALAAELVSLRTKLCAETGMGLTRLYNTMDAGGHRDLAEVHLRMDRAVVASYGWPEQIAQDPGELVARLAFRNSEIAAGAAYVPFPPLRKPGPEIAAELPFHDLG